METDEELLQAAREAPEGDVRAFEQLVVRYQNKVLANCRYLTRDDNNSEDLTQEVFVKAYFALSKFEGRSSIRHWLNRIKVNHCLNHLKRDKGKYALTIEDDAANTFEALQVEPRAAKRLEQMAERERIEYVLNELPTTLRIPLIMRDMDELSYDEISIELGVGLSAVKMRIKRGREQFRAMYVGTDSEE